MGYKLPDVILGTLRLKEIQEEWWKRCRFPIKILLVTFLWLSCSQFFDVESEDIQRVRPFVVSALILGFSWLGIALIGLPRLIYLKKKSSRSQPTDQDSGDSHAPEKNNLKTRKVVTQMILMERVVVFIIVLLALCFILISFEPMRRLGTSLLASAGVAGVIIGFAAQKPLSNVLAGIQIAITQPIRIDDVVIMEGEWGWIEEINLTYVVVRVWDKRRLIIPISQCIEKPFQNWTRNSADILGSIFLSVDYCFPVDELREETTRLLQGRKEWDGQVNLIHVTNVTDKAMELRVLVSAVDSPSAWDLRCYLREHLLKFCRERYPQYLPKLRLSEGGGFRDMITENDPSMDT